ncbi:MAG TPA: 3'(2'),5'-bisphosphate nucleotidase CysQ [Rhodanobacteraceae bacterium]|nr:3'(2'),5'-bisphosphate nucleotidase CysQ [Rhodanobacteraceae bacterium]
MSALERLLPPVSAIARRAAAAILEVYAGSFTVRRKDDASPLTAADLAAHDVIVAGLRELTPQWPVLSEEAAALPWAERSQWGCYWLVDPLDGTREFVKRNGEFTVNIALIENHVSVLGVILAPVTGRLYRACRGSGAQVETAPGALPEAVSTRSVASPLTIAGSRSHGGPGDEAIRAALGPYERIALGSSLKFCLIAEGHADLYVRRGPTSEWDTAAGQCVLEEAGGAVLDLAGKPFRYNRGESLINPSFIAVGDPAVDWTGKLAPFA